MRLFSIRSRILRYLVCYIVAFSAVLAPYEASAVYEGTRSARFSNGKCDLTNGNKYLAFDPFGTNIDYQFDFGNPHCQTLAAASITPVLALYAAMKIGCKYSVVSLCPPNPPLAATEDAEDVASGPITPAPSPNWTIKQLIYAKGCSARLGNTSGCCATATTCASSTLDASLCCGGLISFTAGIAAMLIALGVVHGKANYAYEQAKICGTGWNTWKQLDSDGNESSSGIWKTTKGPKQLCIRHLFLGENESDCTGDSNRVITNQLYREYMYGGIEYEDGGDCKNPKTWSNDRKLQILGYTSNNQRYYMTGPGSAPVYACQRFLASAKTENGYDATQDQAAMQEAYDCCKKRSQKAICIESRGGSKDAGGTVTGKTGEEYKFCNIGDTSCRVGSVDYEIYQSQKVPNYVCAKTFSVCPYNHLLGGGTEEKKTDVNGNTQNFCQYLYHCSKMPILPYVRTSNLTGAHIDSSCRDLKGDTQNVFGYTAELLPINTRGFTAPIVQCVKETMQNIFLNNAGYTKCLNPDETPDQYDQCPSGEEFRKGEQLKGDSFFTTLQKRFQVLIRLVLTLSVMLYGAMLLFAAPNTKVERKSLFPYILKIALIAYFTLGNAWQAVFVNDVLNASSYLSAITFRPDDPTLGTNKLDGCQFPRFDYRQGEESVEKYYPVNGSGIRDDSKLSYPPGKEYLQVWDMLDCKIALSLGFGPEVSVPNLIFMILGGFLTAGYGLIFVIIAFSFAFFMIFIAMRALQFFLVSMIAIVLLLYFSVFIIPLLLFEKTKGIFSGWWKQLLSFVLQPMILFAYLGVLIAIFDNVVMGSATFSPATVTIDGATIVDDYGRVSPKTISCNNAAKNDSVYCIFRVADIKTYTGLEPLGIGLPMLASINGEKLMTLAKAALIMFVFSKFMDNINSIASELTNGTTISTNWAVKPSDMAQKAFGALKAVQDRGKRALQNVGRAGVGAATSAANAVGNRGKKSTAEPNEREKPAVDEVSKKSEDDNPLVDEVANSAEDGNPAADEVGTKSESDNSAEDNVSQKESSESDSVGQKGSGDLAPAEPTESEEKGEAERKENQSDQEARGTTTDSPAQESDNKGEEESKGDADKKDEAENKEVEEKATEDRGTEDKATEDKATEEKSTEDKATEDKSTEDKSTEDKATEDKATEEKSTENKATEEKSTENKATEEKAAEEKKEEKQEKPAQSTNNQSSKSSGGSTPGYMSPTKSSNARNKATAEKFGVKTSTPTTLDRPGSGKSSSGATSSVKTAAKSSGQPAQSKPKESPSANKEAAAKKEESSKSGGSATPSYMRSTAAQDIRNEQTSKAHGVNAQLPQGMSKSNVTTRNESVAAKSAPSANATSKSGAETSSGSSVKSSAKSTGSGSSSGSSGGYMKQTASSAAKQKPSAGGSSSGSSGGGSSIKSAAKSTSSGSSSGSSGGHMKQTASSAAKQKPSGGGSSGGGASGGSSVKSAQRSGGPKNNKKT